MADGIAAEGVERDSEIKKALRTLLVRSAVGQVP